MLIDSTTSINPLHTCRSPWFMKRYSNPAYYFVHLYLWLSWLGLPFFLLYIKLSCGNDDQPQLLAKLRSSLRGESNVGPKAILLVHNNFCQQAFWLSSRNCFRRGRGAKLIALLISLWLSDNVLEEETNCCAAYDLS